MDDHILFIIIVMFPILVMFFALIVVWMVSPKKPKIKDPVRGVLEVTATCHKSHRAVYQTLSVAGVLHSEGMPAQAVSTRCTVKSEQFPSPGEQLPVVFCRMDPTQIRIDWSQVPTGEQRAIELTMRRAEEVNALRAREEGLREREDALSRREAEQPPSSKW